MRKYNSLNFFSVRFPAAPNSTSPVDFIANVGWGAIKSTGDVELGAAGNLTGKKV